MIGKTCSAQFNAQRISDLCRACDSGPPRCAAMNRLSRILRTVAVLVVVFHASSYMGADAAVPAQNAPDGRPSPRHFPAIFPTRHQTSLLARHRATDYRGITCEIIAAFHSDERGNKMAANIMPSAGGRMPAAYEADDLFHLLPSMVQAQSAASIGSLIHAKNRARGLLGRSDHFN